MKFGDQVQLGFRTYFRAIEFIFSKGLWWAFFIPLAFNIVLFWGGLSLTGSITDDIQNWAESELIPDTEDSPAGEFLPGVVNVIIWLLINVLFFFVFAFYGGYLTLMLMSPLFAYLSERTEGIISGKQYPFELKQLLKDMLRGIQIALRNLFLQTGWMLLFFIFGLIPIVGWLAVIPLFMVSAFFYGFSFIDYSSERRRMSIGASVDFVRSHKWLAMANGSMFCFFLLIPVIGVLFSGFAAIVSVVAATLAVNEIGPAEK